MKNTFKFYALALLFSFLFASCNKETNISETEAKTTESRAVIRTMPVVQSGILKFTSKTHLKEFWDDIENAEDAELDALETELGFTSLRKHYNNVKSTDGDMNSLPFEVQNPYDIIVFNKNHELWVGNDVYKIVRTNLIAKVDAAHVSELISIRNTNQVIKENIVLYNKLTGDILPEKPVSQRTECSINFSPHSIQRL